jgi:hypothetical protein
MDSDLNLFKPIVMLKPPALSLNVQNLRKVALVLMVLSLSACDVEYWWSRGKPPSSDKLVSVSQQQLENAIKDPTRPEIVEEFKKLHSKFQETNAALAQGIGGDKFKQSLAGLREGLINLEGKLSYGSRPAYGELMGQMDGFEQLANQLGTVDRSVFSLYTARVYFFLANELTVSPPIPLAPAYS